MADTGTIPDTVQMLFPTSKYDLPRLLRGVAGKNARPP